MEQKLTMKDLEKCFNDAKKGGLTFIMVAIEMPGFEEPEIIINHKSNFDKKLEYYKRTYNDDLTLKSCPDIKIISIEACNEIKITDNSTTTV